MTRDEKKGQEPRRRTLGVLLFEGFELLDVFGPLEMFGVLPDHFEIVMLAENAAPVASAQGPRSAIDRTLAAAGSLDMLLVPGGIGTRQQVDNQTVLRFLREYQPMLEYLTSVCTGAGILAAAGLLDGRRATSNKKSFSWASSQSSGTDWVPQARWVEDGNVWTASGVAAGIDMALALISRIVDETTALKVAEYTEYEWHRDADWDPFAELAGLVEAPQQ